jgi:hypothetical protein
MPIAVGDKLIYQPKHYGSSHYDKCRVAKIIDNPVPPQNACGLAAFNKTMYLSGSNSKGCNSTISSSNTVFGSAYCSWY